jgi:hypothetical protein
VFDIIGKRRWYFLLSAIITIPGLIFILLTPISNGGAGLKFTIDYTGGTKWEIRFKNTAVTPDQVTAVFAANALPASVVSTGDDFLEIKTEPIGLSTAAPTSTPVPTLAPSAGASAGASGSAAPASAAAPSASPSPSPSPSPTPAPSASPSPAAASASPGASASPSPAAATGNTQLPTDGKLG